MKLVIDNFYRDPDPLRALALGCEYSSRFKNLPARRSTRTVIPDEVKSAFSSMLKISIDGPDNRIAYNGCFQFMNIQDWKRAYVHTDAPAHWAAIVYLSKSIESDGVPGGTSFFRHKLTGISRYISPSDLPGVAKMFGLTGEELRFLLKKDGEDPKKWEEIDRIGFVYNRFLLYDARLFHKNGKPWGSTVRNGRLTHNFFV